MKKIHKHDPVQTKAVVGRTSVSLSAFVKVLLKHPTNSQFYQLGLTMSRVGLTNLANITKVYTNGNELSYVSGVKHGKSVKITEIRIAKPDGVPLFNNHMWFGDMRNLQGYTFIAQHEWLHVLLGHLVNKDAYVKVLPEDLRKSEGTKYLLPWLEHIQLWHMHNVIVKDIDPYFKELPKEIKDLGASVKQLVKAKLQLDVAGMLKYLYERYPTFWDKINDNPDTTYYLLKDLIGHEGIGSVSKDEFDDADGVVINPPLTSDSIGSGQGSHAPSEKEVEDLAEEVVQLHRANVSLAASFGTSNVFSNTLPKKKWGISRKHRYKPFDGLYQKQAKSKIPHIVLDTSASMGMQLGVSSLKGIAIAKSLLKMFEQGFFLTTFSRHVGMTKYRVANPQSIPPLKASGGTSFSCVEIHCRGAIVITDAEGDISDHLRTAAHVLVINNPFVEGANITNINL